MYFKIVDPLGHHGMIYKEGINTDILPFRPSGSCTSGGIYFSKEDIFNFLEYGTEVYSVEPIGEIYENPGSPKKWKAHSVNLKYIGKLQEVSTIKFLIENGADIHAENDYALRNASENGHFEIVKFLIENGANFDADNDYALRYASLNGYLEVVKFLIENGANIHASNDLPLRNASFCGHFEVVKFLIENGANIHADNDEALRYASLNGRFKVVKFLVENGANIYAENDYALRYAKIKEIKDYLQSVIDKENKNV